MALERRLSKQQAESRVRRLVRFHWEEAAASVKESWKEKSLNAGIAVYLDKRETKSDAGEMTDNKRDFSGI